jgi:hypothetical protein
MSPSPAPLCRGGGGDSGAGVLDPRSHWRDLRSPIPVQVGMPIPSPTPHAVPLGLAGAPHCPCSRPSPRPPCPPSSSPPGLVPPLAARFALCLLPTASPLSPAPPLPRSLPQATLTELGDVPSHLVVLFAPVQRGGREAPVALAVRGRSHRAAAATALCSAAAISSAAARPTPALRALAPFPPPTPAGGGGGADGVTEPARREAPPIALPGPTPRAPAGQPLPPPWAGQSRDPDRRRGGGDPGSLARPDTPVSLGQGFCVPGGSFPSGCV